MHLVVYYQSPVHGSAICTRNQSDIVNCCDLSGGGLEILQIETATLIIMSVYKLPTTKFIRPINHYLKISDKVCLVIGDFNSYIILWD